MNIQKREYERIRAIQPTVTRRFDTILGQFGRSKRPWLPLWDDSMLGNDEVEPIESIHSKEVWILEALAFWHRTPMFDSLCASMSDEHLQVIDAWSAFEGAVFDEFYRELSQAEQNEFWQYIEQRKKHTLEVEAGTSGVRSDLTSSELHALLRKAKDDRQRFRYLASIVEYGEGYGFTEKQLEDIRSQFETYRARVGEGLSITGPLPTKTLSPLKWDGNPMLLACFLGMAKRRKMLDATWKDLAEHLEWEGKSRLVNPANRLPGLVVDLREWKNKAAREEVEAFITEIEGFMKQLREEYLKERHLE